MIYMQKVAIKQLHVLHLLFQIQVRAYKIIYNNFLLWMNNWGITEEEFEEESGAHVYFTKNTIRFQRLQFRILAMFTDTRMPILWSQHLHNTGSMSCLFRF